jgi:copper chaperone CopZ
MQSRIPTCLVFFTLLAAPGLAADRPAQPQPNKFRIIGMFSLERQDDLRDAVKQIPGVKLGSIDFASAEAVITYDFAQLFPQARPKEKVMPEQVAERLDNLLKTASNHTFGVKLPFDEPRDKLARVEILIVGHDCKGCCLAAYEAVAKVDGVLQATASFKEGRLNALIDPAKTNRAALEEALKKVNVQLKAR